METKFWRWKTTVIDFEALSKDTVPWSTYITKISYIFHYLPLPTPSWDIHDWYPGGWSSEYNEALSYAIELGLCEWVED